jgi:hypothetical protein
MAKEVMEAALMGHQSVPNLINGPMALINSCNSSSSSRWQKNRKRIFRMHQRFRKFRRR